MGRLKFMCHLELRLKEDYEVVWDFRGRKVIHIGIVQ